MRRQSPALLALAAGLGDQPAGDVIAVSTAALDGMRCREPLAGAVDQQPGQEARRDRAGSAPMTGGIRRELGLDRFPGLGLDQRLVLSRVQLPLMRDAAEVKRVR